MNLIYLLLRSSWLTVAIAIFTGLLSGASSAWLIALISTAVSSNGSNRPDLVWLFLGLIIVVFITGLISQIWLIRLGQKVIFDLQMSLSRRILSAYLRHLEELGAPKLLATLTDDVQSLSNLVFVIPLISVDIAVVVGCLFYLGWLSWLVLLVVFSFLFVATLSVQFLLARGERLLGLAREEQDRLFKHFRTITEGTKELKLNQARRQEFLEGELQKAAESSQHYKNVSLSIFAFTANWGQILFFLAIALLLFGLPQITTVETPVLSSYILTVTYLTTPLRSVLELLPNLSRASVALQKLDRLGLSLVEQSEEINYPQLDLKFAWQQLNLTAVTHAYRGESAEHSFTLGPIDLTFRSGELVFIVGGNGSGKSTLVKLITGLYTPETGQIQVDNQLITEQNREWYRQQFSVVFADFYLFEQLLGIDKSNLEQVQYYLNLLQLERKVQVSDGKLSTTALSQGQRKRLALLTAYLEDRPIYVFDEWASDQDPVFKEIFYTQLLVQLQNRGKTVLVISHDDRYFHLGSRIIKLDYGKVEYDKYI
ncbi:MAG: cyclic peptide export ABC transporter [Chroococcus sp. CMT-3BRIN-NPC107]|jgi:putative ATP-binding cassette transporter|nr:cyclic peptide export ABC transporter [Chroococcus sp. CMT-3BRIN-NPC107]